MNNQTLKSEVKLFLSHYKDQIDQAFQFIDLNSLNQIIELVKKNRSQGNSIFVGGNGGSSAISDHLCCDWLKNVPKKENHPLRVYSLTSNTSLLTALSNDYSYAESLSKQLEYYLTPKDLVVLISSSGNSPNIIQAAQITKKIGATLVGFCGFTGGELKNISDVHIHIPIHNYGVVEDVHQSIMHIIAQYLIKESC